MTDQGQALRVLPWVAALTALNRRAVWVVATARGATFLLRLGERFSQARETLSSQYLFWHVWGSHFDAKRILIDESMVPFFCSRHSGPGIQLRL